MFELTKQRIHRCNWVEMGQITFLDKSSSNFLVCEGGPESLGCNNFHLKKKTGLHLSSFNSNMLNYIITEPQFLQFCNYMYVNYKDNIY